MKIIKKISYLYFAFSLIIALFLWIMVVSEEKIPKDLSVPVQFVNVPQNLMVVRGQDIHRVTIRVKGAPDIIKRLSEEDFEVKVDLNGILAGQQVVDLGSENIRIPPSVDFIEANPAHLTFKLSQVVTKEVPVEPVFSGHPSEGLEVTGVAIIPTSAQLQGPAEEISMLKTIPTLPLDISEKKESFDARVNLSQSSPNITILSQRQILVRVTIGEVRIQRTISGVEVKVIGASFTYEIDPRTIRVTLEGPSSILASLTPSDILVHINISGLQPSKKDYRIVPAVKLLDEKVSSKVQLIGFFQRYISVKVKGSK